MHRTLTLVALAVAATGCLAAPKQNYTVEQIPQIDSMEEIMRVQAHVMDPLFGKREQASFTDDEYGAMAEAGRKVQATSASLRDHFGPKYKPSFATQAGQLNTQAGVLLAATEAKDAGKAAGALGAMRDACKSCHSEHR